jgi:uncharacterized membrane protein
MKKDLFITLLVFINGCTPSTTATAPGQTGKIPIVTSEPAVKIISTRCTVCHSVAPTQGNGGITFDTLEQINSRAAQIKQAVVVIRKMPRSPVTLTEEERVLIGEWADRQ